MAFSNNALSAGGASFDLGINLRLFRNQLRKAEAAVKKSSKKMADDFRQGPYGDRHSQASLYAGKIRDQARRDADERLKAQRRANAIMRREEKANARAMAIDYKREWAAAVEANQRLFKQRGGYFGLGIPGGLKAGAANVSSFAVLASKLAAGAAAAAAGFISVQYALSIIASQLRDAVRLSLDFGRSVLSIGSFVGEGAAKGLLSDMFSSAGSLLQSPGDLVKATALLVRFGVASKEVSKDVKGLAAVSLGSADELSKLSLAFAQISSAGRLQGEEMRQLKNTAFNPLKIIAKATGETMLSLRKEMEAGNISFREVQLALRIMTAEGSEFYNTLSKAEKDQVGRAAKLSAKWQQVKITFGEVLTKYLLPVGQAFVLLAEKIAFVVAKLQQLREAITIIDIPKVLLDLLMRGGSSGLPSAEEAAEAEAELQRRAEERRLRSQSSETYIDRWSTYTKRRRARINAVSEQRRRVEDAQIRQIGNPFARQRAQVFIDMWWREQEHRKRKTWTEELAKLFELERKARMDAIKKAETDERRRKGMERGRQADQAIADREQIKIDTFRSLESQIARERIDQIKDEVERRKQLNALEKKEMIQGFSRRYGGPVPKSIMNMIDRLFEIRGDLSGGDAYKSPAGFFNPRFANQIFGGQKLDAQQLKELTKIRELIARRQRLGLPVFGFGGLP